MAISAREALLAAFRWQGGHADIWRVFADEVAFRAIVDELTDRWRDSGVSKVAGIESRGFLLGGPMALQLGVGFVAIRKADGLLPGPKHAVVTKPDYRGSVHRLRMQQVLTADDRVLLVDDWAERGSQALAARGLVEASGATFLGLAVIVDQLDDTCSADLNVTRIIRAEELPLPEANDR